MRVLRAVRSENVSRRHWLAVDGLDNAKLVRADLDERHFLRDALDRVLHKMKARFQDIGLDTDLALGSDNTTLRHSPAEISPLLDTDLLRADVHQKPRKDIPNDT